MPNKPSTSYWHFIFHLWLHLLFLNSKFPTPAGIPRLKARFIYLPLKMINQKCCMFLLATKVKRSQYRISEDTTQEQEGGGFASIRFLAPGFGSIPVPGTRSRLVSQRKPWNEHTLQHSLYSSHVEDQENGEKKWCQSQKSLQFQLHICKPTWTDLARCFLIIIHFPLLMWLNKHNLTQINFRLFPHYKLNELSQVYALFQHIT